MPLGLVASAQAQLLGGICAATWTATRRFSGNEFFALVLMLMTYDVNTSDPAGRRRLRRVARACLDRGQRVQYSVFECELDPAQWVLLRARLLDEIDPETDRLRFYRLGGDGFRRIEHFGAKPKLDLDGPLVF